MTTYTDNASTFARVLRAKALAGNVSGALEYAKANFGPNSQAAKLLEKDIMGTWDLGTDADVRAASRGFLDLVRSRSLLGKISGWFRLPFETPTLRQNQQLAASWVAEGKPIPLTISAFDRAKLEQRKIGSILPVTVELLKGAGADFESALNRVLSGAVAGLEAASLTDPLNAGVPDESPASLTYGVTPVPGSTDPLADIETLLDGFLGDLEASVLVTSPRAGLVLHSAGFESTGVRGGDVAGLVHVTSGAVPDNRVILLDPTGIALADDGVILDTSEQGTLQLADSNGDPTDEYISLWQQNLAAIKVVRYLNWLDLRGDSVAYTDSAQWVS
ncbi:phage major capsid protein [Orrella sp. JC864]|uniref:phage major capsid protein n=1 Tax=Orrella sp. JC864 TaxID=3120298 RepID=UPI0030092492